jgi:hypothetical protein
MIITMPAFAGQCSPQFAHAWTKDPEAVITSGGLPVKMCVLRAAPGKEYYCSKKIGCVATNAYDDYDPALD